MIQDKVSSFLSWNSFFREKMFQLYSHSATQPLRALTEFRQSGIGAQLEGYTDTRFRGIQASEKTPSWWWPVVRSLIVRSRHRDLGHEHWAGQCRLSHQPPRPWSHTWGCPGLDWVSRGWVRPGPGLWVWTARTAEAEAAHGRCWSLGPGCFSWLGLALPWIASIASIATLPLTANPTRADTW